MKNFCNCFECKQLDNGILAFYDGIFITLSNNKYNDYLLFESIKENCKEEITGLKTILKQKSACGKSKDNIYYLIIKIDDEHLINLNNFIKYINDLFELIKRIQPKKQTRTNTKYNIYFITTSRETKTIFASLIQKINKQPCANEMDIQTTPTINIINNHCKIQF